MIYTSSLRVDRLVRGFLRIPLTGEEWSKLNGAYDYEDPTYLGFRVLFDFDAPRYLDSLVPGLLLADDDVESAVNHFRRRGEDQRASFVAMFRDHLKVITEDSPWYIQSVSGLDDLWKIDTTETVLNAKDIELEFETLESVDMRMTFLADLYRKAWFSRQFRREELPVDKRRFSMEILVAEFRNFKTLQDIVTGAAPPAAPGAVPVTDPGAGSPLSDIAGERLLSFLDNFVTVMSFRLNMCEFNFDDAGRIFSKLDQDLSEPASSKFKVRVGNVIEKHTYSLMGWVLADRGWLTVTPEEQAAEAEGDGVSKKIDDLHPLVSPRAFDDWKAVEKARAQNVTDTRTNVLTGTPYSPGALAAGGPGSQYTQGASSRLEQMLNDQQARLKGGLQTRVQQEIARRLGSLGPAGDTASRIGNAFGIDTGQLLGAAGDAVKGLTGGALDIAALRPKWEGILGNVGLTPTDPPGLGTLAPVPNVFAGEPAPRRSEHPRDNVFNPRRELPGNTNGR